MENYLFDTLVFYWLVGFYYLVLLLVGWFLFFFITWFLIEADVSMITVRRLQIFI